MYWGKARVYLGQLGKRFYTVVSKWFEPVVTIGNKERVLKKGECDGNEEQLANLNRTWRRMLLEDPWMKKLMTHVNLLVQAFFCFFVVFFISGLVLPAKHPIFAFVAAAVAVTVPYWLWVGKWHRKIEQRVFAEFRKRFGKHLHLK